MEKIHIKPQKDLVVIDPDTGDPLPQSGKEVRRNSYWLRRLKDGDVLQLKNPQKYNYSKKKIDRNSNDSI